MPWNTTGHPTQLGIHPVLVGSLVIEGMAFPCAAVWIPAARTWDDFSDISPDVLAWGPACATSAEARWWARKNR